MFSNNKFPPKFTAIINVSSVGAIEFEMETKEMENIAKIHFLEWNSTFNIRLMKVVKLFNLNIISLRKLIPLKLLDKTEDAEYIF